MHELLFSTSRSRGLAAPAPMLPGKTMPYDRDCAARDAVRRSVVVNRLDARRRLAASVVVGSIALAAGCGAAPASGDAPSHDQLRVVGLLYGEYMSSHGGSAPKDQAALVEYLKREPANWNKLASSPEDLLKSPRNGTPLTVVYGSRPIEPPDGSLPWVARESEPIDGRQLMVNVRGNVRLADAQEIAQCFASP